MILPVNDGGENEVLAGLRDASEIVGDGEKALELREVLHADLLDGRAELEVLEAIV